MAIMDALCQFQTSAQTLTSVTSSSNDDGTNYLDLTGGNASKDGWGTALNDLAGGAGDIYFNVAITTVADDATGGVSAALMSHTTTASFKSGNELAVITFPLDAAAGTRRSAIVSPVKLASDERYVGVNYFNRLGTTTSAGVLAWLSNTPVDSQIGGTEGT